MSSPKAKAEDGQKLWNLLADGRFHKAKTIAMASRMVRAVCSAYPDRFLSTQAGYKRVDCALNSEIENAIADLKSRCGHLTRRYTALERVLKSRSQPPLL